MVAQLHLQAAGVQNIRALVSVLLDPASSSYGRWWDQVLTLRRYALDDHVLVDSPIEARDVAWLRLNSVDMSWIFGIISLDLQDLVRTHGGTARQAWLAPSSVLSSSMPPSAPSSRETSPLVSSAGG